MNGIHGDLITKSLTDVMEQMAFMFVNEGEQADPSLDKADFVKVSMIFHGPVEGELTMVASERMCVELSSNILGLDKDDPMVQESSVDALKEILNVICGHILTGIAGKGPAVEMCPPLAQRLSPEEWDNLELSPEALFFSIEDHPVLVQLELEGSKLCPSAC